MKCDPNSHYELCADTCTLTCSALSSAPQCPDACAEGCQCDPGFLSDGQACVPIQKCGCYHDGIYYEVGTWSSPAALRPHPGPLPTAHQPHSLCTRLQNVPPTHFSTTHGPTVIQLVPSYLAPSQPSLLLPSITVPMAVGKTFVNKTVAPATLNPPLTPQVKLWLCLWVQFLPLLYQRLTPPASLCHAHSYSFRFDLSVFV